MGRLGDFFKKLTGTKRLTDGTVNKNKQMKDWKRIKKEVQKSIRKGERVNSYRILDCFESLDGKTQLSEWEFVKPFWEAMRLNEIEAYKHEPLLSKVHTEILAPMLRELKSDEDRDKFVGNIDKDIGDFIKTNEDCALSYDNQFRIANLYLDKYKEGVNRKENIPKMINHLKQLAQAEQSEKASQFVDAMITRKSELPQNLLTTAISLDPRLQTAEQVCYFVNSSLKDEEGKYMPNVSIEAIQKICADKILDKYRDPKDGEIPESNRESILTEMSEVNRQFEGKVYLGFANIQTKNAKNNMPAMPLIRNNDLFAYARNSRQSDQIKEEDRRANLDDIKGLKRDSFSITSLDQENKRNLIGILSKDDLATGVETEKIDGIVEDYFGIKKNMSEYDSLVSTYSDNCLEDKNRGSSIINRVDDLNWDGAHVDLSSSFCTRVAKTIAPEILSDIGMMDFEKDVKEAEKWAEFRNEATEKGIDPDGKEIE